MAIRIVDHELPYATHNLYDVHLDESIIHTLVTHTPRLVDQWIAEIQTLNEFIVGLDIEWRPNFQRNQGDNPVAVIQLCVGSRCLIFQILHSPIVPESLDRFFRDERFKFVGVGIGEDVEKLVEWYNLSVVNQVDLRGLAVERRGIEYRNAGIKTLARDLLGKEIVKPKRVTMSRWDTEWLTNAQVQYACLDAFLSYEIGRVLSALPNAD